MPATRSQAAQAAPAPGSPSDSGNADEPPPAASMSEPKDKEPQRSSTPIERPESPWRAAIRSMESRMEETNKVLLEHTNKMMAEFMKSQNDFKKEFEALVNRQDTNVEAAPGTDTAPHPQVSEARASHRDLTLPLNLPPPRPGRSTSRRQSVHMGEQAQVLPASHTYINAELEKAPLSAVIEDENISKETKVQKLRLDATPFMQQGSSFLDNLWRRTWMDVRKEMPTAPGVDQFDATHNRVRERMSAIDQVSSFAPELLNPPPASVAARPDQSTDTGPSQFFNKNNVIASASFNRIPELTSTNFDTWRKRLFAYIESTPGAVEHLLLQEHGRGINSSCPNVETPGYNRQLDRQLGGLIVLTISSNIETAVISPLHEEGKRSGTLYFLAIKQYFLRETPSQRNLVKEQLRNTRQEAHESVSSYVGRLQALYNRLSEIGGNHLEEEDKVTQFMNGLRPAYRVHVAALRVTGTYSHHTLQSVVAIFQTIEEEMQLQGMTSSVSTFVGPRPSASTPQARAAIQTSSSSTSLAPSSLPVEMMETESSQTLQTANAAFPSGSSKGIVRIKGYCRYCHQKGHRAKDCYKLKRDIDTGEVSKDELTKYQAMWATEEDYDPESEIFHDAPQFDEAAASLAVLGLSE